MGQSNKLIWAWYVYNLVDHERQHVVRLCVNTPSSSQAGDVARNFHPRFVRDGVSISKLHNLYLQLMDMLHEYPTYTMEFRFMYSPESPDGPIAQQYLYYFTVGYITRNYHVIKYGDINSPSDEVTPNPSKWEWFLYDCELDPSKPRVKIFVNSEHPRLAQILAMKTDLNPQFIRVMGEGFEEAAYPEIKAIMDGKTEPFFLQVDPKSPEEALVNQLLNREPIASTPDNKEGWSD